MPRLIAAPRGRPGEKVEGDKTQGALLYTVPWEKKPLACRGQWCNNAARARDPDGKTMPAAGQPVHIGQMIQRYRIVEELGRGGFGVVFKAHDEALKRPVAIKFLLSKSKRDNSRFFREAIACTRVEHPSIVQVIELGSAEGEIPYIVMEFVNGRVLTALVKEAQEDPARGGRLGMDGLRLAWQVACVLAETHERGIIHRDLKPPNVMVVPDAMVPGGQRVKILDFGIAKILPQALGDDPHGILFPPTDKGEHPGTPAFMAPEQWRTQANKDGKIDVYALGCMAFLFLSGRLPFESSNPYALLMMHLNEQPASLEALAPGMAPEVLTLVHRMLAKAAEERPTMAEVRDELAQALGLQPYFGPHVRIGATPEADPLLTKPPLRATWDGAIPSTAAPEAGAAGFTANSTRSGAHSLDRALDIDFDLDVDHVHGGPRSLSDLCTDPQLALEKPAPALMAAAALAQALEKRRRRRFVASLLGVAIGMAAACAVGTVTIFRWQRRQLAPHEAVHGERGRALSPPPASLPPAPPPLPPAVQAASAAASPTSASATADSAELVAARPAVATRRRRCDFPEPKCVSSFGISKEQQQIISLALHDANIRLCTNDLLAFRPRGGQLVVEVIPERLNRDDRQMLETTLKAYLKDVRLHGAVTVSCDGR